MAEFKKGDRVLVKPGMSSRYGWAPEDAATPLTVQRVEHDYRVFVRPPWDGVEYSFRPEDLTHAEPETPAPLDPSKVKPGDTVTVRVEPNPDTGWGTLDHGPEAIEVTGKVWLDSGDNPHGPVAKVGVHALGLPNVTLTAHTPRPHAERAPEGEVTAAVERGAEDLRSLYLTDQTEPASRYFEEAATVLNAALGVEEMARVISSHRHGSEVPWPEDRRTAEALRAAILGEES